MAKKFYCVDSGTKSNEEKKLFYESATWKTPKRGMLGTTMRSDSSQSGQLNSFAKKNCFATWGQCYETFSVRDLRIFVLSYSV